MTDTPMVMEMSSTAVVVENPVVERGGQTASRGLSYGIRAGEVTGLLGPSGCGKTTLVHAIGAVMAVEVRQRARYVPDNTTVAAEPMGGADVADPAVVAL
ncbi:ATP-binding cassette domain-containing protein [Nocardia paucivorans]|uniref:ATP-binding cassette domain-containing protein n=1 Tax=Nocardia paucivorans TaxID=114259 RepID=UPI0002D3DD21|nr:ATP-binding cassette domain-containing protein [Nocardia paucivorans]